MDTDGKIETEETLTRTELQIEQEKLKLERERILLEHERLEIARERINGNPNGRTAVKLSTVVMLSIICTLVGGILGTFSTSLHWRYREEEMENRRERHRTERLQEVMQSLASETPEAASETNETATAETSLPPWLKAMKPRTALSGVSVLVIQ